MREELKKKLRCAGFKRIKNGEVAEVVADNIDSLIAEHFLYETTRKKVGETYLVGLENLTNMELDGNVLTLFNSKYGRFKITVECVE